MERGHRSGHRPSNGNIYVFHRNEAMPIMAFDKNGKFLRAWGQGMFKTTHFLRTDREGNVGSLTEATINVQVQSRGQAAADAR